MKEEVPKVSRQQRPDKRLIKRQNLPKWLRFCLAHVFYWIGSLFMIIGDTLCSAEYVWPYHLYQYFMCFSHDVDTEDWVWESISNFNADWNEEEDKNL